MIILNKTKSYQGDYKVSKIIKIINQSFLVEFHWISISQVFKFIFVFIYF